MKRFVLALALAACAPEKPPPRAASPAPLAAVLAVAVCPEIDGRLFALASGADGIVDTYVLLKRCNASVEEEDVRIVADAYAWLGVDRDFGPVGVHEFVHATVHADVRVHSRARFADDRLALTLTAPAATIAVEPVGVLDLSPLNWASLLALELAPSAGTSPEALAKKRLRTEAETTLTAALKLPILVAYDARSGTASIGATAAAGTSRRLRVVPHGTALAGPFAGTARLHALGSRVAVRAVCRSHAERILDADRRGDSVATDEWMIVTADAQVAAGTVDCPWMLAIRSLDDAAAVVDIDLPPATSSRSAPDRWVAIDAVSFDEPPQAGVGIVAGNDVWRRSVFPAVVVLAPDEHVTLRAELRGDGTAITIGEGRLLDGSDEVTLVSKDGRPVATVHVRTRIVSRR